MAWSPSYQFAIQRRRVQLSSRLAQQRAVLAVQQCSAVQWQCSAAAQQCSNAMPHSGAQRQCDAWQRNGKACSAV
eukprot:3462432-Alexandrium_andersonii.AAC.1